MPNIIIYQLPDRSEILSFSVKGQCLTHPAVEFRQVCKGGLSAASLQGQTLELGQGCLFPNELRPALHVLAGDADALGFAFLRTVQNSGFLLWIAGAGCHCIQFALRVPETGQSRKHRLKVWGKVFDFQIRQRVGRKVWLDEDCTQ